MEMKEHNKSLADAAHDAGVIEPKDYAIFQNKGYQGLYGGLGRKDIHERKSLKKSQANQAHYEVGQKVRQTIADLGGTMPEDLPTPRKSIRQIEKERQKKLKQADSP